MAARSRLLGVSPVERLHAIASSARAAAAKANDRLARIFMKSDTPLANVWIRPACDKSLEGLEMGEKPNSWRRGSLSLLRETAVTGGGQNLALGWPL
jgi:hypothetical protein